MSIELPADSSNKKKKSAGATSAASEAKIKATVAWNNPRGEVGLQFAKLSDVQKRVLENYFRIQSGVVTTSVNP